MRLQDLPEDTLGLIFHHLHTDAPSNPAVALAQSSRVFLAAFARTMLHTVSHSALTPSGHTAALLRVAGPHLRSFTLASGTPPKSPTNAREPCGDDWPQSRAPVLLDTLALYCPCITSLEVGGVWGVGASVVLRRVLHACQRLDSLVLVNPPMSVLRVLVCGDRDCRDRSGRDLKQLVLRFDDADCEALSRVSERLGVSIRILVLDWTDVIGRRPRGLKVPQRNAEGMQGRANLCLQDMATEIGSEKKSRLPASYGPQVVAATPAATRQRQLAAGRRASVGRIGRVANACAVPPALMQRKTVPV